MRENSEEKKFYLSRCRLDSWVTFCSLAKMVGNSVKERDALKDIVGVCAGQTAAVSFSILSPLVIGGLIISFEVGEAAVGGLITLELLIVGVTSIALAPLITRLSLHWLAITGVAIMIICNLLSAEVSAFTELYSLRVAAAIGGGISVATCNAAIARGRVPVFLYGVSWAAVYVCTSLAAVAMSQNELSYPGAIRWCALLLIVALPLLWLLPRRGQNRSAAALVFGTNVIGCALLAGMALMSLSMMAYYAFVERLADARDAGSAVRGMVVAGVYIGGIIGGVIAAPVAARFGIARALLVAVVLHAAAIIVAVATRDVLVLGIAAFCEAVIYIAMVALMLALAAEIDQVGRWAAAGAGTLVLSSAFGPLLGGILIESSGYGFLGWLQILAGLPALAMFTWAGRSISRLSRAV